MKSISMCGLIWSVLLFNTAVHAESVLTSPMTQARAVVEAYLDALVQGDLEAIRHLLGGTFLKKKEMLLNDADYSARLIEIYSAATYEITDLAAMRNNKVAVDVTLNMGLSNAIDTRFIVSKIANPSTQRERYLITDEISQGI